MNIIIVWLKLVHLLEVFQGAKTRIGSICGEDRIELFLEVNFLNEDAISYEKSSQRFSNFSVA